MKRVTKDVLEIFTPDVLEPSQPERQIQGIVIGRITGIGRDGAVNVDYFGNELAASIPARSTVEMNEEAIGREAALLFEQGDPARPIVIGLIWKSKKSQPAPIASLDDERIVLTAQKEIVLRCGKASITLTRAGKVLIRGAYVGSSSSGVHRIRGGSVQIN